MNLRKWSECEVAYGRKVLISGLAGARSGRQAFLNGRPLTLFLGQIVRDAFMPAAAGAIVGVLGSFPGHHHKFSKRTLVFGCLGWAIGLGFGIAWQTRGLNACAANGALENIGRTRDEHWLETHPIDYA